MSSEPGAAPMTPTQEDMAYAKSIVEAVEQAEPLYEDKCLAVRDLLMRHRLAAEERGARMALEAAVAAIDEGIDCDGIIVSDIARLDPAALKGAE